MGKALGIGKRRPLVSRIGEVSSACAEALLRVAHLPGAVCRAAKRGAESVLKARTFAVRVMLGLQASGFEALFASLAAFRAACSGLAAQGGECVTVVGISHSWDETKQMLRDPAAQPQARQSTQRIARDILVQKTAVHAVAVVRQPDGGCSEHSRAEAAVVPPLELFGKQLRSSWQGSRKGLCSLCSNRRPPGD